jgi:hypothetical protein
VVTGKANIFPKRTKQKAAPEAHVVDCPFGGLFSEWLHVLNNCKQSSIIIVNQIPIYQPSRREERICRNT